MKNVNNKKHQDILKTAKELFWKHGFKRVSVEEICREANVSKMTFYKFFPNKIELAKSVIDSQVNLGVQNFKKLMAEDIPPSEKIKKLLQMKYEGTNDISKEFLQDFYINPKVGLKSYFDEKTKIIWEENLKGIKEAQKQGWMRNDVKAEFLIYISQKMGEMIMDDRILKLYNSPQELIMEMTNFFAYGISPHE